MRVVNKLLIGLSVAIALGLPATGNAQQSSFVPASKVGGTANAVTLAGLPVGSLNDLLGVPIRFLPASSNAAGTTTVNPNGLGVENVKRLSGGSLVGIAGGDFSSGVLAEIVWDGTEFVQQNPATDVASVDLNIGASALGNSSLGFNTPTNLQLNSAVASSELTVSVCTINSGSNTCNNPSSTNPVLFQFRDPTAANGDPVIVSLQASLSFTTGATSDSFGCTTAVLCRLWVWAINNSGTVDLCLYNAEAGGPSIVDLNDGVTQSSASGTGGGTSAQTLYCSASAVSGKAVRRLGYVEATWTSGTGWTGPTTVQLFGPGIHKPGEVLQVVYGASVSIAPTSAVNLLKIFASGYSDVDVTSAGTWTLQTILKRGSTSLLSTVCDWYALASQYSSCPFVMVLLDNPATTSSITYSLTASGSAGAALISYGIMIEEVMGALDEPANDNGSDELRMTG